jgi:hypothetical protein
MTDYPQPCGCIIREELGPCGALYLVAVCAEHLREWSESKKEAPRP